MDIGLILLYLEKQMWERKNFGRERRVIFLDALNLRYLWKMSYKMISQKWGNKLCRLETAITDFYFVI